MLLADNIVHFARVLRRAGLRVGPDRVLTALAAVELVGLDNRQTVHAALSAVMLDQHEQQPLFDAAFEAFWRDPKLLEQMMLLLLPKVRSGGEKLQPKRNNRLAEALSARRRPETPPPPAEPPQDEVQFDATLSFSERERLQQADFDTMTPAEFALARRLAEQLPLPVQPVQRRRRSPAGHGRIDLRRSLQQMARQPHTLLPAFSQLRREQPALVVLLDISGSMGRYARLFLHYLHGLTRRHLQVQTLTFGTRLTNISRSLRHRDPDAALALADAQVADWNGGTRISSCLAEFNRHWARRLLGGNAALLLVSDGLDRDNNGALADEAQRLRRLARQIVWLNPLLRFDGFEPRAAGVRALLPQVDFFLPVHNLASLADLGAALRRGPVPLPALSGTHSLRPLAASRPF